MKNPITAALVALLVVTSVHAQSNPRVLVQTELGEIVLELDAARAPITTANFLEYVDAGHYDGGTFHRTVRMDNQAESPVRIEVIQAGVASGTVKQGFGPISLERTNVTGIRHTDGVVSMARSTPDSATSGWFITINDQPSLDLRRPASSRRTRFCRVWTRGVGHGRGPQNSGGASVDQHVHEGPRATPHAADQNYESVPPVVMNPRRTLPWAS